MKKWHSPALLHLIAFGSGCHLTESLKQHYTCVYVNVVKKIVEVTHTSLETS